VLARRFFIAAILSILPWTVSAQRNRPPSRGPAELQRAVDVIREWSQARAIEGNRACRFQAVLNAFIEVDRALDPMQPNVSISKASDQLAIARRLVPQDRDSVSFSLRALVVTAGNILDPHLSPDIAAQREHFHREVLEPAYRLVTPEVINFVESAQQLDLALRSVSQAESDMSALILHAIHGDCTPTQER
jgi:hypothetical protein